MRARDATPEERRARMAAAVDAIRIPAGLVSVRVRARVTPAVAERLRDMTPDQIGKLITPLLQAEPAGHLAAPGPEATIATMAAIKTAAEAVLNARDAETATRREAQELSGTLTEAVMAELAAVLTTAGSPHGWPPARVDHDPEVAEYSAILEFPAAENEEDGPFIAIWLYPSGFFLLDSRQLGESVWLDCPAELLQAMTASS